MQNTQRRLRPNLYRAWVRWQGKSFWKKWHLIWVIRNKTKPNPCIRALQNFLSMKTGLELIIYWPPHVFLEATVYRAESYCVWAGKTLESSKDMSSLKTLKEKENKLKTKSNEVLWIQVTGVLMLSLTIIFFGFIGFWLCKDWAKLYSGMSNLIRMKRYIIGW